MRVDDCLVPVNRETGMMMLLDDAALEAETIEAVLHDGVAVLDKSSAAHVRLTVQLGRQSRTLARRRVGCSES